jgi:hypothetical protein
MGRWIMSKMSTIVIPMVFGLWWRITCTGVINFRSKGFNTKISYDRFSIFQFFTKFILMKLAYFHNLCIFKERLRPQHLKTLQHVSLMSHFHFRISHFLYLDKLKRMPVWRGFWWHDIHCKFLRNLLVDSVVISDDTHTLTQAIIHQAHIH